MPLILGTNSIKDVGYDVANSCRFDDGSSDKMTQTFSTPTTANVFTFSFWLKRSNLSGGSPQQLLNTETGNLEELIRFDENDRLHIFTQNSSGAQTSSVKPSYRFRDVSAWYHIVIGIDTGQGTDSDRYKFWVNGTRLTDFDVSSYISSGYTLRFNTAVLHEFGVRKGGSFINGYFSELTFIDGQQLDADQFGEYDEDSPTIWKPKDLSDLTFGNNGFWLDFEDSSALGNDVSGNNNDWTVSNLTSVDQSTDTCTNNFATLNPLYKQDHAFSQGNLGYTSSASDWDSAPTTIAASSGKYYCEMKVTATAGGVTRSVLGICDERDGNLVAESEFGLTSSTAGDNVGYGPGAVHKNGSGAGGTFASYTTNDIIGMYADLDNGKVYFSKNGDMQNSGDPTSGSTGTGAISITTGATYLLGVTAYGGGASQSNFGSPPYAITSGNADPNGYGNFEYGTQNYYALNSKNLAEFG
jgi:hypothetical protein